MVLIASATSVPTNQGRWLRSISTSGAPLQEFLSLLGRVLHLHQVREELARIYAMRRVVRTRVHTVRLVILGTQVAGGGLGFDFGDLASQAGGVLGGDIERLHVDVAVGAVVGAQAAADAPVFDDDLQAVAPPDGPNGTAHHAERVFAVP